MSFKNDNTTALSITLDYVNSAALTIKCKITIKERRKLMTKQKAISKIINLLYTVIIPVLPLFLHIFINGLTKTDVELKNIYPEIFFATISICIESFKSLQIQLKNNELKQLIVLIVQLIFLLSSVSYGCILASNNAFSASINVDFALLSSVLIFISGIFIYGAILIVREV